MSLLHEIQKAILDGSDISPIMLKLRFLAAKLGSNTLEGWIKYENDGYPKDQEVPDYRKTQVGYKGSFFNSAWKYEDVSLPGHLIAEFAGDDWVNYEIREGAARIDDAVKKIDEGKAMSLDTSNLPLVLQDKIYPGMNCVSVTGQIPSPAFIGVQSAVRTRLLEFTLELEKQVPAAVEIVFATPNNSLDDREVQTVTQITNQTIYGNVTGAATAGGEGNTVNIAVGERDMASFVKALKDGGLAEEEAVEIAQLVDEEGPNEEGTSIGARAMAWVGDKLGKGIGDIWKAGMDAAPKLIEKAAKQYLGLP